MHEDMDQFKEQSKQMLLPIADMIYRVGKDVGVDMDKFEKQEGRETS